MNFWALPPEITSTLIYSGPGSYPMTSAASAWSALAAEMRSAAGAYQSVISRLTSEEWMGPASATMAAAATPYVVWMGVTAEQAEQVATQARTAASAYETAHVMTVPPAAVMANRVQLHQLISTNILGQNTPAIAATDAEHHEMWAQDTIAMHGYHAQSTAAAKFTPFSDPPNPTNPAAQAAQAGAVGRAAGTAAGTQAAQGASALSAGTQTLDAAPPTPAEQILNDPGVMLANQGIANTVNTANLGARSICAVWRGVSGATGATKFMGDLAKGAATAAEGAAQGAAGAAQGAAGAAGGLGGVAGGMGQAGSLGGLSVPPNWAPPTPPAAAPGPVSGGSWQPVGPLGSTPMTPPPGMPGVPGGAAGTAGAGYRGFGAPRYGVQLTVMPRTSFGG